MDKQRRDFESRIRSIEGTGGGFRASKPKRERDPAKDEVERKTLREALKPLRIGVRYAFLFGVLFLLKAGFIETIGPQEYDRRVQVLAEAGGWSPAIALLMQRGNVLMWSEPGVSQIMGTMGLGTQRPDLWPDFLTP
ncbi:MAG: hypothetical protein AAF826_13555 [Pseudomonadota bacterium]